MLITDLSRLRRATDDASPERWRLHIIGPMLALYAALCIAVTVMSMAR